MKARYESTIMLIYLGSAHGGHELDKPEAHSRCIYKTGATQKEISEFARIGILRLLFSEKKMQYYLRHGINRLLTREKHVDRILKLKFVAGRGRMGGGRGRTLLSRSDLNFPSTEFGCVSVVW